ncbi:MAG TPA: hypothetical protein VGK75_01510 [Casimicrobiaceae bacterium]|jgi:hypothetical protein
MTLRLNSKLAVAIISALVFSLQTAHAQDKFAKYESPASISTMDWLLLQANLKLMRDLDATDREKAEIPFWYYNKPSRKIAASVRVSWEVGKGPLDRSRKLLTTRSIEAFVEAQQRIPELTHDDAEIVFFYIDYNPDGSNLRRVEFAFYRKGELTFP